MGVGCVCEIVSVLGLCVYICECVQVWSSRGEGENCRNVCMCVCAIGREKFYPEGMVVCMCVCECMNLEALFCVCR